MASVPLDILINATDRASGPLRDINKELGNMSSAADKSQTSIGKLQSVVGVGLKAAVVGAVGAIGALGTALGVGVAKAAGMEQQLANIAAVTGKSMSEMDDFKTLISELGMNPNLKVTAIEAGQAIEMLAKNGVEASDIIGTMGDVMSGAAGQTVLLANATGADFATAADVATDVMAAFKIQADEMSTAVDQIVGVTVASKFSIDDYRLAMAQAGGAAGALGVEFEDFNASLTATSYLFASGSDAGTSFKAFMNQLTPSTIPATDEMRRLGLFTGMSSDEFKKSRETISDYERAIKELDPTSKNYSEKLAELNQKLEYQRSITVMGQNAFFDLEGNLKSMPEIAGLLQDAFAGLSEEQRATALETIFLTDGSRTAIGLLEVGADKLIEIRDKIMQTDTGLAAGVRVDTFSGQMEILEGVVDNFVMLIGDAFLPVLRDLAYWITNFIADVGPGLVAWFKGWADAITPVIRYLQAVGEDGDELNDWFKQIPTVWQPAVKMFASVVEYFRAINGTTVEQVQAFRDLPKPIQVVINNFKRFGRWIDDTIGKFIEFQDVITALGIAIAVALIPAVASTIVAFAPVLALFGALVVAAAALRTAWQSNFGNIRSYITNVANAITRNFNQIMQGKVLLEQGLANMWTEIASITRLFLPIWQSYLIQFGVATWEWIINASSIALTKLGDWMTSLKDWVVNNLPGWKTQVATWADGLWEWIVGAGTTAVTKLGEWAGVVWQWATDNAATLGTNMAAWGAWLYNWVTTAPDGGKSPIVAAGDALISFANELWMSIVAAGLVIGGFIVLWAVHLWNWLTTAPEGGESPLQRAGTALVDFGKGLATKIGEAGTFIWEKIKKWGRYLWSWLTGKQATSDEMTVSGGGGSSPLEQAGQGILSFANNLLPTIISAGTTLWTQIQKWSAFLWEWATAGGEDSPLAKAKAQLTTWRDGIQAWFDDPVNLINFESFMSQSFELSDQFYYNIGYNIGEAIGKLFQILAGEGTDAGEDDATNPIAGFAMALLKYNPATLLARIGWNLVSGIFESIDTQLDLYVDTAETGDIVAKILKGLGFGTVTETQTKVLGLHAQTIVETYDNEITKGMTGLAGSEEVMDYWHNVFYVPSPAEVFDPEWHAENKKLNQAYIDKVQAELDMHELDTAKIFTVSVTDLMTVSGYGIDVVKGFDQGLQKERPTLEKSWKMMINGLNFMTEEGFGIRSPSTVYNAYGVDIMLGFQQGMEMQFAVLLEWFSIAITGLATWWTENRDSLLPSFITIGIDIVEGIALGFSQRWSGFVTQVTQAWNALPWYIRKWFEGGLTIPPPPTGGNNGGTGGNNNNNNGSDVSYGSSVLYGDSFTGSVSTQAPQSGTTVINYQMTFNGTQQTTPGGIVSAIGVMNAMAGV